MYRDKNYHPPFYQKSPNLEFDSMKYMTGWDIRRIFNIKIIYAGSDLDLDGKPLKEISELRKKR